MGEGVKTCYKELQRCVRFPSAIEHNSRWNIIYTNPRDATGFKSSETRSYRVILRTGAAQNICWLYVNESMVSFLRIIISVIVIMNYLVSQGYINRILVIPTNDRLTGIFLSGNMTSWRTSYDVLGNENTDSLLVCYCMRVSTNGLSQHYDCHYRVGQLNITKIGVARRKLQFKNT